MWARYYSNSKMPPIQYISKHNIPARLNRIHPPLRRLYCRGTMPDFDSYKCLAVIGARKCSDYGEQACREIIKGLKGYPILIVSGLAIGIDSVAHEAALENGLLTVSVPGSGLDEKVIYPKNKLSLAREIVRSGGCLLSEYDSTEVTGSWVFPERNRVMAGLADAVLIIEASRQSGTSITARLALDYNKEVLVVPGSIFEPLSEGPHFLMKLGAQPATCAQDIIEALGLEWMDTEKRTQVTKKNKQESLFDACTDEEKKLLALLPSSRDDLMHHLEKPMQEIQMHISLLEIKGIIKEEAGMIYST